GCRGHKRPVRGAVPCVRTPREAGQAEQARVHYCAISTFPVICGGIGIPINVRIVGARSPSLPSRIVPRYSLSTSMQGTRLVVCAVFGVPSGLIIMSALP